MVSQLLKFSNGKLVQETSDSLHTEIHDGDWV